METLQKREASRMEYLRANDQDSLEEKQRLFENRINGIKADVAEVFGDTIEAIKLQKLEVNKELRQMSLDAAKLETHTGTEIHYSSHTAYKHQFLCFKWGSYTEHYSYTTTYTYLAASDALEQINVYGKNAASEIEEVFRSAVELKAYRRKLLDTVVRNFDAGDKDFDGNYFRMVVQNTLNQIDFPEVHIDVSEELEEIGKQFSGEVRDNSDQERFRLLLSRTVENLYASIVRRVDETIGKFQQEMMQNQARLCDEILEKVLKEFTAIKAAAAEKEKELEKGEQYIRLLNDCIKEWQYAR